MRERGQNCPTMHGEMQGYNTLNCTYADANLPTVQTSIDLSAVFFNLLEIAT
jgi:hypothetical protein